MTKTIAALLAICLLCPTARATIQSTFDLEQAAWDATDIVVVTQDESLNGNCTVFETWKGGLHRDDTLNLPALREYAPAAKRAVNKWGEGENVPSTVDGRRLVLFLKRSAADPQRWENTNYLDHAVVWIQDGNAYAAMLQPVNPGPLAIYPLFLPGTSAHPAWTNFSELRTKLFVLDEVQQQSGLAKAALIENREQRKQAFGLLAESKFQRVSDAAKAALASLEAEVPAPAPPAIPADAVPLIEFNGIKLSAAVRSLARQAGFAVEFSPKLNVKSDDAVAIIDRPVTRKWENTSPRQALAELLETNGLQMAPAIPGKPVTIISKGQSNAGTNRVTGRPLRD